MTALPMILNVSSSKGNVRIVETRLIVSVNRITKVHRAQVIFVDYVTGCMSVHVYKELEMQSVHFWPNAVSA